MVALSLIGDKGVLHLRELKQQEVNLKQEIEGLKKKHLEWADKVRSLKSNKTYIETLAREKLGLVRPEELVIQFEYDETADH